MDIEDEEASLVGINEEYKQDNKKLNSPTKYNKNTIFSNILSYSSYFNNSYILSILLFIVFFIYFIYSRNIYIEKLNIVNNNINDEDQNNNIIHNSVTNTPDFNSNYIDPTELIKDIKSLQSKICKCDKCPVCPLSEGFVLEKDNKINSCPICPTNSPTTAIVKQPTTPSTSKFYLPGDRTDKKNSVYYIHSDVPDSELPSVKLYLDGDPWIPWETKNQFNDCSNYCSYVEGSQMKTADGLVYNIPSHSGGFYSGVRDDAVIISFCLEAKGPNGMCGRLHDKGYYNNYHLHSSYDVYIILSIYYY